ncbi:MAG: maltose alpha-D-glucosyltransferase [Micromonosporaceae bacterium]
MSSRSIVTPDPPGGGSAQINVASRGGDPGPSRGGDPGSSGSQVADGHVLHPTADDFRLARVLPVQPDWFKRAVFYEVLVRAFHDSTANGTGDLRGLAGKLDYLAWLGVDCLWLPPFYDSPLRDGGYDIRDFYKLLPDYGTIEDFVLLLDEAHQRGIRVITDLVMNHTSDQHPWFAESRRDPDGEYGDYYVWQDTDSRYPDARVIFVDTEESNWTFDPVRQQFYWHRFFSHQPDLNYDNPRVRDEMLNVLRFWLDLGIDGFRLDAVPYLYERDATNCENLPETHSFLRQVRKVVDDQFPGRVLLAEANQWPTDVVQYFGDADTGGDECHMAFHFPLMPRIFMAVRRQSRFPVSEILAQTPTIPEHCQWGIFLRNHDELTLEMVTDEERDYMYTEYATDPRMRANIGIRRRLAPLLDNDRDQLELFTALLLSLPGSPVLYYGDEIGMGDNIWLGDRDSVRTPMQWTPDRNAGFSSATPGRLYLPTIMDPIYGYQAVNVEVNRDSSTSFLHWTRRLIEVRKRHPAFAVGEFHDLGGSNPTVLSYVREHPGPHVREHPGSEPDPGRGAGHAQDIVLCVNNLSRFPQPIELSLRQWEGYVPVELTGRAPFPAIGELPYLLTLPGHAFYWFQLTPREELAT